MLTESLKVGAGAVLGALARYAIVFALSAVTPAEVFGITLTMNAVGCLAMGFFAPGKFWGTGFLGGFTTFSAVSLAAAQSSAILALAIMAASFGACVGGWLIGDAMRRPAGRSA
ncbi:CrcB family protein [Corynebacterium qintianiae]|uniref:Fluoride-specific ion channel n=1 Tax=Corynebacterium qintianiae TaxID=2709392 RepID=A0A7T0PDH3_9CORY|nr:CrcB family protein [Corynebacterium qintianiae]QPK82933.1 CrcB family protein [Corynebacterium qintianiae]